MRVGSLFSGIGGLDLGLERAGMTVVWQSEIDSYASRVLAKHWPTVPNLGDITTIDWSDVEPVDLICGGYPCQPFSAAGKRLGGEDHRHLWPYVATAIRELRPRYALMENVAGHLSLGFGRVLGDLAEIGYDAAWDCIPATAVGAPHRRDRVFIVANTNGEQLQGRTPPIRWTATPQLSADTDRERLEGAELQRFRFRELARVGNGRGEVADAPQLFSDGRDDHGGCCSESSRPLPELGDSRRDADTECGWWAVEPDVGRVAHGVPSRVDRLKCLGNAVVPQVAEWVGRRIMEAAS